MLENMKLAAPEDAALVQLLSRWARRGRRTSPEPQVNGSCLLDNLALYRLGSLLHVCCVRPNYLDR